MPHVTAAQVCGAVGPSTSFYLNCDVFGVPAQAPRVPGEKLFAEEEIQRRLSWLSKVSHPRDKTWGLANEPTEPAQQTPSIGAAARHCAANPHCVALCRSDPTSWTFYFNGLRHDFEKADVTESPWTCLAMRGERPPGTDPGTTAQRCFVPLSELTHGQWTEEKVLKDALEIQHGHRIELLLADSSQQASADGDNTLTAADAIEARAKCAQDRRCEAVCFHAASGRVFLYGPVHKALQMLAKGDAGWAHLLEPAKQAAFLATPSAKSPKSLLERIRNFFGRHSSDVKGEDDAHYDRGWVCLSLKKGCRHKQELAAEAAGAKDRKQRATEKADHKLLLEAFARSPPEPLQGLGSPLAAQFWGKAGLPSAEDMSEWRQKCSNFTDKLAHVTKVPLYLPQTCHKKVLIRKPAGRWLECCEDQAGFTCRDQYEWPDKDCNCPGADEACLSGNCVDVGKPGQLETSSGQVFEVLSQTTPQPALVAAVSCLGQQQKQQHQLQQPRTQRRKHSLQPLQQPVYRGQHALQWCRGRPTTSFL